MPEDIAEDAEDAKAAAFADHEFTPEHRYPPSTAIVVPVMKLAASEARKTAAPATSSGVPKRRIGVRVRISCPRSVPVSTELLICVGITPGAMALTLMPSRAHSMASVCVRDSTPIFETLYATTSYHATNDARLAMFTTLPPTFSGS